MKPCAPSTARNAATLVARSFGVRCGTCAAVHTGSDFTARLRSLNSPSTALYTRVPVKNRVRMSRRWAGLGARAMTTRGSARLLGACAHEACTWPVVPGGGPVPVRYGPGHASAHITVKNSTDMHGLPPPPVSPVVQPPDYATDNRRTVRQFEHGRQIFYICSLDSDGPTWRTHSSSCFANGPSRTTSR